MNHINSKKISIFLKSSKKALIWTACLIILIIWIIVGPTTVAFGNGFSHKIGSFGNCDKHYDGCTTKATHRIHSLFDNEDYCESCWERSGEDWFERLSDKKTSSTGIEYDENKCRHSGCNKKAKSSDWDRRFCPEHLQGTRYCRYPHCSEQIPINGTSVYCWKHR